MKHSKIQKPVGPGCDELDPGSLPYEVALEKMLQAIVSPDKTRRVKLRKSLGRILAKNIKASMNVPNHTNSAMDGYAFAGSSLEDNGLARLEVIGTAYAGKPFMGEAYAGQTVKIMTGAIMPKGTDTVVMQEYSQPYLDEGTDKIEIAKAASCGQHVRQAGEDIAQGTVVLKKGTRIASAELGLIASMGLNKVVVYKKARVAFFSNGDEVRQVGEALDHGEVYDSNRHALFAMLKRFCVKTIDLGIIGDSYEQIKATIEQGNDKADMVITSAGASVGEADYIYDILAELGSVKLWKLAIKPGRPLAFGKLSDSVFFGLPGNPVSVMTTFALCVKPCLEKMAGQAPHKALKVKAKTISSLRKRPGRNEYQRALAYQNEQGELIVDAQQYQGSGVLSSMTKGNCFISLPLENTGVEAGDMVDIILFTELFG